MTSLIVLPAFLKVSLTFIAMLGIYRLGIPLGWSILTLSLGLTLWSGAGVAGLAAQGHAFLQPDSLLLLVAMVLLLHFTEALNKSGRMERTVNALRTIFPSGRLLMASLPALVGLLPMPGGALVSAPMVGSVDKENSLPLALKVATNYWFRHIWEYWWPLYPGVILAIRYSGLPVGIYLLVMTPFTLVAALSGYFFILRRIPAGAHSTQQHRKTDWPAVIATIGPIGALVVLSVSGSALLPSFGVPAKVATLAAMVGAVIAAQIWVLGTSRGTLLATLPMFKSDKLWSVIVVVAGVQVLSAALQMPLDSAGITLVGQMRDEFVALGVPLVLVVILIPFISGFVTGIAVGFVGASFPLVFALLGQDPSMPLLCATAVLAYSFGYIGMILSPVHICFVVTNEYFKSKLFKSYPYLLWPMVSILVAGLVLSGLLYTFSR